jgi:hypothetical protein
MDADGIYLCESASIRGSLSSVAALPLCEIRGSTPLVAVGRAMPSVVKLTIAIWSAAACRRFVLRILLMLLKIMHHKD